MLKFESNNGIEKLEMKGNINEIQADVTVMILRVYEGIKEDDEELAEVFKDGIMKVVGLGLPFAGENLEEEVEKAAMVAKASIKALKELEKEVKEMEKDD